jgi:SAM-dependent methyltransferase
MTPDKETTTGKARTYFEFLADMGLTKHLGSVEATRQLIDACRMGRGDLVLDVGCGVGATPFYLARTVGARVIGVDLLERMVQQARGRARSERVADRVAFAAADARRLPFADGAFDAVIMESVNVFFDDKARAMESYMRAARPGGYVGMTEMTWLNPPPPEKADYYRRTVYAEACQAQGWVALLEDAGLEDVTAEVRRVDLPREGRGRVQRYGCRGMLRVLWNMLTMTLRDRASRAFLKDVTTSLPRDMIGDMGWGVYAGRKPGP